MFVGITGGTSGLGERLVQILHDKGCKLKVLVRKTSKVENLKKEGIDIVLGDITDPVSLINFVKDIDICYHIAAQVDQSTKEIFYKVNVDGTKNICSAIINNNPNCKLVYCSSIAIKDVKVYNHFLLSNYTLSKYYAEKIVDEFILKSNLKATVIYPGYMYGPCDKKYLPGLINLLKNNLQFIIRGGEKNAPIVFIDDICELFYLAGIKNESIGKKYSSLKESEKGVHDFIKMLSVKIGIPFPKKVYPKLPMVIYAFLLKKFGKIFKINFKLKIDKRLIEILSKKAKYFNTEAKKDLGWDQKTSLSEGLEIALNWYQKNLTRKD